MTLQKLSTLEQLLKDLYEQTTISLPFHGWHHIVFVRTKTKIFAEDLGANPFLAESAALVHDLNYFVKRTYNTPEEGKDLTRVYLTQAGYTNEDIEQVHKIVSEINTWSRDEHISLEAKALSDADMLFKCLPITPMVFTSKYMEETKQPLRELADTVVRLQGSLLERNIYFYSNLAKEKYQPWAEESVELFRQVLTALEDKDIASLVEK